MFRFNAKYLILTIFLFLTELVIALFIKDTIIRPFVGDVLVVILVYCFVRIFLQTDYKKTAVGVLLFAFTIEILQYFDYVRLLGLENNRVLSVALGKTFAWEDFIAYFVGFLLIILFEKITSVKPKEL
ncbi:MAG: DUF2809 domain-containing protein [Pyrinomonadaceae bacterium]|jgi:hypothetical protein|nr:DUF2809 domain-containing protein [Pyrinomonadaceae bacterium]